MTIDLTQIILAVLTLAGTIITRYLIPWLKSKTSERQFDALKILARTGVYAAEQIFTTDQWREKKEYVLNLLEENGYSVDSTSVDALIEAMVRELRIEQGQVKKPAADEVTQ